MIAPIAITMGCPVGIGPEIIIRLFEDLSLRQEALPVIIGDLGVLRQTVAMLDSQLCPVIWQPGQQCVPGTIPVFVQSNLDVEHLSWGRPSRDTSLAMAKYIRKAVEGIELGAFSAMVTCPISKKALNEAGVLFPGHTEMLAELTGTEHFRMMMAGDQLRVVLVTIHEPLSQISSLLNVDEIVDCIEMTAFSLQRDFAISSPRIALAGINPHAGEQGMFGREEIDIIMPAIKKYTGVAQLSGPWPPDTVFLKGRDGAFDAVIAMYHDQGLIPFKMVHFKDGVNVTLGLPIVRTSVDHGTAYDIAGQGKADWTSLAAAWKLAVKISVNRLQVGL